MKTFKLLSIITSLLLVFACSNTPSGSEYLGKWALKLKYTYWEMNITRVNESFLVEGTFNQDGIYTITKENNLVQSGIMGTTITYDKNTNTLIVSSGDDIDRWTRLQDEGEGNKEKNQLTGKTDKSNNSLIPKIKRLFKKKIKDIDGNVYTEIKIGKQVWMVENLRTTKFNDGSSIANITSEEQWNDASRPGYCWCDNDIDNKNTYGALYNWYAVESGILCPKGWHVPSDDEWKQLEMYLGMNQEAADDFGSRGTDEGGKLKETGTRHWQADNIDAFDTYGFTALPGGCRYDDGSFTTIGVYGYWWSSTESKYGKDKALERGLVHFDSTVFRSRSSKGYGFSVRCLRD